MLTARPTHLAKKGFTLIEVMLVLLIMGLAASAVIFNYSGETGPDLLKKQSQRLQVVFNMAADFAVLNQWQLGLRVEQGKNSYYFMILDENEDWQKFALDQTFDNHQLPELFSIDLSLTDLPWQADESLFSSGIFDEELSVSSDEVEIGKEEDKKLDPPQIFIFSSGEITPFTVTLKYEPEFTDQLPVYYRISAQDSIPLIAEGPLDEL